MRIQITGKSFNILDSLKDHIEEKIKSINNYYDNVIDVKVTLFKEKYLYKTEITLHSKGSDFVVSDSQKEVYYSFDSAFEKLEKKIKRYKDKTYKKTVKPKEEIFEEIEAKNALIDTEDNAPRIIRMSDKIPAKPMTLDEAVINLSQEHENILVFQNSMNGNIGIVFRRNDGNIGFIEPQRQ